MKRILALAAVFALACTASFAQVRGGDARARGMGGAMTAVNDDMNTLFYNPAGLAFLKKNYLVAEADIESTMQQGATATTLPLYYCYWSGNSYEDTDGDGYGDSLVPVNGEGYVWWNPDGSCESDEQGFPVLYDLASLAGDGGILTGDYAPVDADGDGLEYEEYAAAYEMYAADETLYNSLKYTTITISPRLMAGGPHWGAALMADYDLAPVLGAPAGDATAMSYAVSRTLSAVAGTGFNLGGIALGANLRYSVEAAYWANDVSYVDGPGEQFLAQLFNPDESDPDANYTAQDPELAAGLGALFTLGTVNLGLYNDNVVPFLDEDNMDDGFFAALLDTTNLGLSWMPSNDKFGKKSPITLIVAADIDNLGDADSRQLAAGAELGFDLFNVLAATARVGYTQPLGVGDADVSGDGKELFEMSLDDIDPDAGRLTAGITAKLWFAKVDLGVAMPLAIFQYLMDDYPSFESDEYDDELFSLSLTVSASF